MTIYRIAFAAAVLGCLARADLHAQGQTLPGYPNVDKTVAIAVGDTVLVLNQSVSDRSPGALRVVRRLDIQYATRIPAADASAREQQANRAALFFAPQAEELGLTRLSVGICDSRACAEMREPPTVSYWYQRTPKGDWKRAP